MWKATAEGDVAEVYGLLKQDFLQRNVRLIDYERVDVTVRGERPVKSKYSETEEGASEQFRFALKSVQGLLTQYSGTVKITCSGEKDKSTTIKVEAV